MRYIDFVGCIHRSTQRDYLARVNGFPKAEAARVAKRFGRDYWDGDRKFGYGGYVYDGRWRAVADLMRDEYGLTERQRILDVGCGKAALLYDLSQAIPGVELAGVDVSTYAIEHAKAEVRHALQIANACALPFPDDSFDFVYSINTLHNLRCHDLERALLEIERVGRKDKYICVESYRTEEEKVNLLYWQLTCESFYAPDEWEWWFKRCGYTGDYSFIFFE